MNHAMTSILIIDDSRHDSKSHDHSLYCINKPWQTAWGNNVLIVKYQHLWVTN